MVMMKSTFKTSVVKTHHIKKEVHTQIIWKDGILSVTMLSYVTKLEESQF